MFSKVKRALKNNDAQNHQKLQLETPVIKRIHQLTQIHDMAKSLLHDTREIIKMFDQDEGILKNSAEVYAASLRILGTSVNESHPDYTTFLVNQAEIYDELGHLQRRFQHELSVRVVTPLNGWIHADYARMSAEIHRLYEKKKELDSITASSTKDPNNNSLAHQQDLCRREYERQLEITKLELLRLSMIKNEHAKIINQFGLAWKEYTLGVRNLFNACDGGGTMSKSAVG